MRWEVGWGRRPREGTGRAEEACGVYRAKCSKLARVEVRNAVKPDMCRVLMTGHDSIGRRRHSRVLSAPSERSMAENVHEHTDGHSAFARAPRKKWDGEGQEPSVPPSSWNEGPTSVCACLARWYVCEHTADAGGCRAICGWRPVCMARSGCSSECCGSRFRDAPLRIRKLEISAVRREVACVRVQREGTGMTRDFRVGIRREGGGPLFPAVERRDTMAGRNENGEEPVVPLPHFLIFFFGVLAPVERFFPLSWPPVPTLQPGRQLQNIHPYLFALAWQLQSQPLFRQSS